MYNEFFLFILFSSYLFNFFLMISYYIKLNANFIRYIEEDLN